MASRRIAFAVVLASLVACGSPTAPSSQSGAPPGSTPSPPPAPAPIPPVPPPAPAPPGSTFTVDLPIAAGDVANAAYGLWPFGTHGGDHALDGHPGWDVEYRPGASVLAAADGVILNGVPEMGGSGRFTVRIMHAIDGRTAYATDYTNLSALGPGISAGATVRQGQVLGPAGVQTQIIGTTQVTWAMTHFQVNDFSRNEGLTNPNAVSPEPYLSSNGRGLFASIWRGAAYQTEWCEPFFTNPRSATFPLERTWTLESAGLATILGVRCPSASSREYTYSLQASDRSIIESGVFVVDPGAKPLARVEFRPSSGSPRLGVWDIVGDTMQLNLAAAGGARPTTLVGGSMYTTR